MIDITHKINSLRKASATAIVKLSKQETVAAIRNNEVPKGNIFEFSRAAGLLAIKKTSDVIPDCHPLPLEYAAINHEIDGLKIIIHVEVHTIYKTGVEVEAMHGAAITALTIYDMLKPMDKEIEISEIRLSEKKGGKSDFKKNEWAALKSAVIVCSDTVAKGENEDLSGKKIVEKLKQYQVETSLYDIVSDDAEQIRKKILQLTEQKFNLVIFTGGTGLSPRDITPDTIAPLLDRDIPGIMETARQYGQERTPYAMLSRGVAGFIKDTLVITLPGSVRAVEETMDALFPYLLHVFQVTRGMRH